MPCGPSTPNFSRRSEEHTSELQSLRHLVCRLLLEKKKIKRHYAPLSKCGISMCDHATLHTIPASARLRSMQCAIKTVPLDSAFFFFFFNDTATTEIYTLSLHDALPI